MSELKTLKDLEGNMRIEEHGITIKDILSKGVLKQSAIKDIKHFKKLLDSLSEYNKKYAHKNKEGKELPKEAMEGVFKGKIDYIKWKFNLKEEDLK